MAQFIDPFPGMSKDGPLSEVELIQCLRQGLAAEEEATHFYTLLAERADNEKVKEVLLDIAREEQVHIGEFQQLIEGLDAEEKEAVEEGREEVAEMKEASDADRDEDETDAQEFESEGPDISEEDDNDEESEDGGEEEKEASTDFRISTSTLKEQLKQRLEK